MPLRLLALVAMISLESLKMSLKNAFFIQENGVRVASAL